MHDYDDGFPEYPDDENYFNYDPRYSEYHEPEPFVPDKWYYHIKVHVEIIHETELAYLLKDSTGKYWIPKKLIHFGKEHIRQYKKFIVKYLKE